MTTTNYNGHKTHHNAETDVYTVIIMESEGVVLKTMQAKSFKAAQRLITAYNNEI